jgi:predicted transposase YdaD
LRIRDFKNSFDTAREEGIKEGRAIGIATSMKLKGYPLSEIADITGLSQEQIENLTL